MLCKKTFSSALIILLYGGIILLSGTAHIRAQQTPKTREKPELKNFGSSIKKKKGDEKPETNSAKSPKTVDGDEEVIRVDTLLVRTDVLVVDSRGVPVTGLKASDFIVTENDVPQEIGAFSLGETVDVPKSIVLIIDYSGSQIPFIKNSVEAAKVLVDRLNPKDRLAIVTDDVELLQGFTDDKKLLKKKLDDLAERTGYGSGGGTKTGKSLQFSALMATLQEMFDEEDVRPIIIFQTDGDEAFNITNPDPESPYTKSKKKLGISFTADDLFNRIQKSRATIYSVVSDLSMLELSQDERAAKINKIVAEYNARPNKKTYLQLTSLLWETPLSFSERLFRQQTAMMIVARASGGFTESLETPDQADAIYARILNDINNRYLIGYYPKNATRDGKRRTVKIEVRGHSEYIIWGRKTYFAPDDLDK